MKRSTGVAASGPLGHWGLRRDSLVAEPVDGRVVQNDSRGTRREGLPGGEELIAIEGKTKERLAGRRLAVESEPDLTLLRAVIWS